MGFTLPSHALDQGREMLYIYPDPHADIDGRAALISERFNPHLPPDWSLIQLKINFVEQVATQMRRNRLPATSGGSANISGWVHVCSVIGGGVSWEAWQGLNEFEQAAILQQANEHNRLLEKKAKEETEQLTQQMTSLGKQNQPSVFDTMRAGGNSMPNYLT